ncbi:MAG: zinc ABC transporter substrate-binding protein [Candidatus Omnitrophica bacterium]|nr:zinc ABC transporter substrate-binding protein [Candidatus Omnitrophota bacterium]
MKGKIIFVLALIMTAGFIHCHQAHATLNIVTTIGQISNVTKEIGGERVDVVGLMGPGVDPHLYKATESDVRKLAKADLIFYNGLFLEAKMGDILERMNTSKRTVPVGEYVDQSVLLDSVNYVGHHDPHIWFDVTLWQQVAKRIEDVLIEEDPEGKEYYQQRAVDYQEKLKELHQYVSNRAAELPDDQRILVTAHDAFRYFGQRYNFNVVGLQGISTESQAGTKDVMDLAKFIATKKIKAIFVETSVPERNIKAVQDAVRAQGWDVKIGGELFSDAMGDEGSVEGTYIGMVKHNINTIVNALK